MNLSKILLIAGLALFMVSSTAIAGDFGWTNDFNFQAQADPSGFRTSLATRFNIGDAQVQTVISNFDSPADAYIALRFGEMSARPVDVVIEEYNHNKGKGWGALAKSLGIKPGSAEFHALKRGHDLHSSNSRGQTYSSVAGNNHVKGKNKGKGKKRK